MCFHSLISRCPRRKAQYEVLWEAIYKWIAAKLAEPTSCCDSGVLPLCLRVHSEQLFLCVNVLRKSQARSFRHVYAYSYEGSFWASALTGDLIVSKSTQAIL